MHDLADEAVNGCIQAFAYKPAAYGEALIQDLELAVLVEAKSCGDKFRRGRCSYDRSGVLTQSAFSK